MQRAQTGANPALRTPAGDVWGAAVRYALVAEQGCPQALLNLGWLMHRGEGAEEDDGAALPGGPHSPLGVPRSQAMALQLFQRAARLGEEEGMVMAGHLLAEGKRHGLAGGG